MHAQPIESNHRTLLALASFQSDCAEGAAAPLNREVQPPRDVVNNGGQRRAPPADAVGLLYRFRWVPLAVLALVSVAPNLGWPLS